jgi:hypothetical protein
VELWTATCRSTGTIAYPTRSHLSRGSHRVPLSSEHRPVAVRFRKEVALPYDRTVSQWIKAATGRDWSELLALFPGLELVPYYEEIALEELIPLQNVTPILNQPPFAFTSCYRIWCPPDTDREKLAEILREWPGVQLAYAEGDPSLPAPTADPLSGNQGYLNAAKDGIGARAAWSVASGAGVGFVDLECDWQLAHVDLPPGISRIWGDLSGSPADITHGTSVLGIVAARDNGAGIVGIAPDVSVRVVSHFHAGTKYHIAEAILEATRRMARGDVLLLEVQLQRKVRPPSIILGTDKTNFPAEVDSFVFDQVLNAVSRGIVVVAAAGNGSRDLDLQEDEFGVKIFDRSVRDSGAILVAAATSPSQPIPHAPHGFTNFGDRIDCFARGDDVFTTIYVGTGTTSAYTPPDFGGTSAAAAIVAGAALLLQSWKKSSGAPYAPLDLRAKLADRTPLVNTPSANGPTIDKIGVMPNLANLLPNTVSNWRMDERYWAAFVRILFGVTTDGGGVVWKPGVGPIPVDPWGPNFSHANGAARLIGLAAREMSKRAGRAPSAKRLAKAARRIIVGTVKKMNRRPR